MQAHKGYYSLVQYCPNPGRAEVANVGVLVFCPDLAYIDAALSKNNRRVIEVFGRKSFDAWWLSNAKRSFLTGIQSERKRFQSLVDLEQFVTTRGNELVLTKPRALRIEDAASALQRLYAELVEPLRADLASETPVMLPNLDALFRRLAQQHETVKIAQTYDVPQYAHRVRADYVYENGVCNLLRVLPVSGNPRRVTANAVRLGGESIFIDKHLKPGGKSAKLVVVAASEAAAQTSDTEDRLQNLFSDYPAEMIRSSYVDQFLKIVEQQAH